MVLRSRSLPRVYEIGQRIAVGGMGEVYDGVAKDLGRRVAIKRVLKSDTTTFEDLRDLFLREVAVAATLEHPNVVEVLDAGSFRSDLYMVMEFVDGASLADMLAALRAHGRVMPVEMACGIVSQIARGLAHAHERALPDGTSLGIIHRDIAPENVLVAKNGIPKLVDFGLATLAGHNFTTPGTIRGRPRCLSPEQARGDRLDLRSDIFALGGLMFELLSGQSLYKEEQLATLLWKVTNAGFEPLTPRIHNADPDLILLLETALALSPRDRFRSAREMERALDNFRAARGMRVDAGSIGALLTRLDGDLKKMFGERQEDGPGELERTNLVLPADELDALEVVADSTPELREAPMARPTTSASTPTARTSSVPSRTPDLPVVQRLIPIDSSIPKPEAPARMTGDLQRFGALAGESEGLWIGLTLFVVLSAALVFYAVWARLG